MTTILALETTTTACSVALRLPNGEFSEEFILCTKQHAELILPLIEQLLKKTNCPFSQLNAIAFGAGPGSFMGTRLGASVTQALAYAYSLPVIPVSSLQALAQTTYWKEKITRILTGWDARLGEIYLGAYEIVKNSALAIQSDKLVSPATLVLPEGEWLATGNAWETYHAQLPCSIWAQIKKITLYYPHAKAVAFLAHEKFKTGNFLPPEKSLPFYIRDNVTHSKK